MKVLSGCYCRFYRTNILNEETMQERVALGDEVHQYLNLQISSALWHFRSLLSSLSHNFTDLVHFHCYQFVVFGGSKQLFLLSTKQQTDTVNS